MEANSKAAAASSLYSRIFSARSRRAIALQGQDIGRSSIFGWHKHFSCRGTKCASPGGLRPLASCFTGSSPTLERISLAPRGIREGILDGHRSAAEESLASAWQWRLRHHSWLIARTSANTSHCASTLAVKAAANKACCTASLSRLALVTCPSRAAEAAGLNPSGAPCRHPTR